MSVEETPATEGGNPSFAATWITRITYAALVVVTLVTGWVIFNGSGDAERVFDTESTVLAADGQETTLAEYVGKPLVVNFYASTCAPCRAELPDFEAVFQEVKDDVEFVGINSDTNEAAWRSFDEEVPVSYDTVFQPESTIFVATGALGLPTTLFVDEDGTLVKTHSGVLDQEELKKLINQEFGEL